MIAEFTLRLIQLSEDIREFWVRRTKDWIPTVDHSSHGKPTRVLLTNVSAKSVWCPAHFPVILWAPHGELPPDDGYLRLNSAKYSGWQVLAYEAAMDKDLLKKEQRFDRTEAAVTLSKSARGELHQSETTASAADDSARYEHAESAGDDPASSAQAVTTSCELTDCDIDESVVATQSDTSEWDDGPNAWAAHQPTMG
ncbi:unnamed protein product [Phytophthora fragariaefolia]|uniref:Unnamed protein product n=1 Tax=Phytophthora fragariaefolia TaxID=1490495 RepID=A0A9W6X0X4_9STRA|nr:unnamed protein product [Phytophthora fragariaefolia]